VHRGGWRAARVVLASVSGPDSLCAVLCRWSCGAGGWAMTSTEISRHGSASHRGRAFAEMYVCVRGVCVWLCVCVGAWVRARANGDWWVAD
jgi:hypothetical protein